MKMIVKVFIAMAAVAVMLFGPIAARAGEFKAGAAVADITPDVNKWKVQSIGYFSQKVMTSVNDPIRCKALVVTDGEGLAAIVTCDLMGTPPVLRQKILDLVKGSGIDDHNLLISCSHTHSGPGNMMPNLIARIGFGAYNEELTQWTAQQIAAAVKQAQASMQPASMSVAETTLDDVTRNRRDPAGSYNYDTRRFSAAYDPNNPKNDVDPTLTVIRIDAAGKPIAVLFHFATHGTVLGAENLSLSADWPGVAQKKIEAAMPGTVVMYMNGAQGDQAPAMLEDNHTDLEWMDIIGGRVADGVMEIVDKTQPVSAVPVRAALVHREVPPGDTLIGYKVPKALVRHYFGSMPLQAVRVGDVVLMAVPVEAVCAVGQAMKNGARGQGVKYPLVAGLSNDHLLYTAAPDDFPEGGYEVDMTALGILEPGIVIGEQMLLVREVLAKP